MNGLERIASRVKETKIFGVPVGDALLLLIGLGVNEVLVPTLGSLIRLPNLPAVTGAGIGVIAKLPVVERFLGPTMGNVLSATALATGLDHQIGVKAKVQSLISRILPAGTATAGAITSGVSTSQAVSLGQAEVSEQERRILETLKVR